VLHAFVADVHLGNHARWGGSTEVGLNRRCRQALDVLRASVDLAEKEGAGSFTILGDLFDTPKPSPQLVAAAMHILGTFTGCVVALAGNHEVSSTTPGDNALAPLREAGVVVFDGPELMRRSYPNVDMLMVPWQQTPEWWEKLKKTALPLPRGKKQILCLHTGLVASSSPDFLAGDGVRVEDLLGIREELGISWILAGHWHRRWAPNLPVMQVGALVPTGFDNPGLDGYGTVVLYDDHEGLGWREVPGPRFVTLERGSELPVTPNMTVFLRVKAWADEVQAATAHLKEWVAAGLVVDGEVVVDTADAEVAARTAACAARSADTLDEAVRRYVAEMLLPEGVKREVVLTTVLTYLGMGGEE